MRTHIVTAGLDMTIANAVDLMDLYQVTLLPVVDATGVVLGVVTEHDIAAALLPDPAGSDTPDHRPAPDVGEARRRLLVDIMTRPAICVDEHAGLPETASLMMERSLKRLPVTSDGKVVGMVGRIDLCQAALGGHTPPAARRR